MLMTRRLLALARDRAAATAVEFALIAPVLLVLLMGMAQFGITMNSYVMLTEAAADGARYLALARGAATPYTNTVAQVRATASGLSGTVTVTTYINNVACSTDATCTTALAAGVGPPAQPAKVTATYPCNLTVMGVTYAPSCTLTSSTTQIIE
jgi:Flp pilus assembly protein TadG